MNFKEESVFDFTTKVIFYFWHKCIYLCYIRFKIELSTTL